MKTKSFFPLILFCLSIFFSTNTVHAQTEATNFKELKGKVVDSKTNNPLIFADLVINESNISTITNSDGDFILKIPNSFADGMLTISRLGYEKKEISISKLETINKIKLNPAITELKVVQIETYKNAKILLKETLEKKGILYNNNNTLMTAFYRETIKKRRKNASLSEAIVQIHSTPYNSFKKDGIELIKSRKKTDYSRLDTLAVKLQGGPFSNLYTDIIKYPEYIFTPEDIDLYDFSFDEPTQINNNMVYVVNFKQKPNIITPLYYGKLYIDYAT